MRAHQLGCTLHQVKQAAARFDAEKRGWLRVLIGTEREKQLSLALMPRTGRTVVWRVYQAVAAHVLHVAERVRRVCHPLKVRGGVLCEAEVAVDHQQCHPSPRCAAVAGHAGACVVEKGRVKSVQNVRQPVVKVDAVDHGVQVRCPQRDVELTLRRESDHSKAGAATGVDVKVIGHSVDKSETLVPEALAAD